VLSDQKQTRIAGQHTKLAKAQVRTLTIPRLQRGTPEKQSRHRQTRRGEPLWRWAQPR